MAARVLRVLVVVVIFFAASCGALPQPAPVAVGAGSFVAVEETSVEVVSASTGQVQRVLLPVVRGRLQVDGLSLLGQMLFVTYGSEGRCTSGVAGCAPAEDSCGGEVDRFDLATGSRAVVWKVGPDSVLADAVPSPDQTRIVALAATCGRSYFDRHLVVRDSGSGAQLSIGGNLARCHLLSSPRWVGDGTQLLVIYAAASTPAFTGPEGTCTEHGGTRLVRLDATRSSPGVTGSTRLPGHGCAYESLAARGIDVYAVATCGPDQRATLERLDDNLAASRSWPLGSRSDDSSVAISAAGDVLVADYHSDRPQTVLSRVVDGRLTTVSTVELGTRVPSQLSW